MHVFLLMDQDNQVIKCTRVLYYRSTSTGTVVSERPHSTTGYGSLSVGLGNMNILVLKYRSLLEH